MNHNNKALALAFTTGAAVSFMLLVTTLRYKKKRSQQQEDPVQHLMKLAEHSFTAALIRVGDQLGLYEALWQQQQRTGPSTTADLAVRMKCDERWLKELLSQATAAGLCHYHSDQNAFSLKPEYAPMLRDPSVSKQSMLGLFEMVPGLVSRIDAIVQATRTGVGMDFDYGSHDILAANDRKNSNWYNDQMVSELLSQIVAPRTRQNLVDMLTQGIQVANVGCGYGSSVIALAKQFPKSTIHAYEISTKSIAHIEKRVQQEQLSNVIVHDVQQHPLGQEEDTHKFQFVYCADVVHDMTHPKEFMQQVKHVLAKDDKGSVFLIVDSRCFESLQQNLEMPNAALAYGYSCLCCLASATACPKGTGAAALGSCGFPEALARQWAKEIGFEYFTSIQMKSKPTKSCFVIA